jgi:hypothetical protein
MDEAVGGGLVHDQFTALRHFAFDGTGHAATATWAA